MRTPTPTAKNDSKYNNYTLECIELSTCTELSLKIEREKTVLELSRLRGRNKQKLSQYLFSFIEKHLIVFLFTKFKSRKQNPNDLHKEVKSEPIFFEPSS